MKEIRDIKIDLLMGNQNPIIECFKEMTKDLRIINCDVYDEGGMEFIYYNKDGEWIFYQDAKNGEFWAHYKRYWSILEREFSLEYLETQAITKLLVEEALRREVYTPFTLCSSNFDWVEEALKREVYTPSTTIGFPFKEVEEALKREVATPVQHKVTLMDGVEEALKREVAKPRPSLFGKGKPVESALKKELDI